MNAELPLGTAARVVALARAVAEEQHPQRRGQFAADAQSSLERDLALDSLGRVELLGRLEGAFGIELPEQVLGSAETVQDLIAAVDRARPRGDAKLASVAVRTAPVAQVSAPLQAQTVLQVLDHHAAATPDRVHVRLLGENDAETPLTYGELRAASNEVAAGLRARGLEAGATVVLMLPTSLEFFYAYFGVLRAGGVPVPIYPPARLAQIEEHLRRHAAILDNAQTELLITVPEATRVARLMGAQARAGLDVVTIADLRLPPAAQPWPAVKASDLAFIQYTSGSTGDPKGVMLTHANLLANIRAMGKPFALDPAVDVFVSWLPLYHDMGLIGAWLGSLYFGLPLVVMSPLRFLAHPVRWLQAIHTYRGTVTASPNFGYELARSRSTDAELAGLDLRSLRIAANGAEAVLAATLRGFHERFAPFGLRPGTVRPVYGLAESSVGLAFPPQDREAPVDRIRRAPFLATGAAIPAAADEADAVEFVACGQPIPGHEIRVVDAAGREVPERQEGAIQFRGPSSTQGYFRNPTATAALLDGTWLRTGDRGYLWNGDIVITGRAKDIIIRAGRNLYPAEIEAAVGAVPGIRRGCVAVFGAARTAKGTESLVVMAETRATDAETREALIKAATAAVVTVIGEPPDDVRLVPPYAVLKTSSGKIRRAANRERYERGDDPSARRVAAVRPLGGGVGARGSGAAGAGSGGSAVRGVVVDGARRRCAGYVARGDGGAKPAVQPALCARGGAGVPGTGRCARDPDRRRGAGRWAGAGRQSHELLRRGGADRGVAERRGVRRQEHVRTVGADRAVLAPPGHGVRRAFRRATRGGGCGRHPRGGEGRRARRVLPGRHVHPHAGVAAVPQRCVRDGGRGGCAGAPGGGARRAHLPARPQLVSAPRAAHGGGGRGGAAGRQCVAGDGAPACATRPARNCWI